MLERYNESAKQAIFAAREAVSRLGAHEINPAHLILGIWDTCPNVINDHLASPVASQEFRTVLEAAGRGSQAIGTSEEVPFTESAWQALRFASVEAEDLRGEWVSPEHIVLGVLRDVEDPVSEAAVAAGIDASGVRAIVQKRQAKP